MRPSLTSLYVRSIRDLITLIEAGCSPASIAAAVLLLDSRIMPAVSRFIEDKAHDGTFAAGVFDILAGWAATMRNAIAFAFLFAGFSCSVAFLAFAVLAIAHVS
jgi:hypothetical protein